MSSGINRKDIFSGSESQAVDMLIENLQLQIDLNKSYEIQKAITVAEQTAGIANYVKKNKLLEKPEYKRHKDQVQSLYKQLDMTITTARNEVAERLQEIQKSKKTLGAYANNSK